MERDEDGSTRIIALMRLMSWSTSYLFCEGETEQRVTTGTMSELAACSRAGEAVCVEEEHCEWQRSFTSLKTDWQTQEAKIGKCSTSEES